MLLLLTVVVWEFNLAKTMAMSTVFSFFALFLKAAGLVVVDVKAAAVFFFAAVAVLVVVFISPVEVVTVVNDGDGAAAGDGDIISQCQRWQEPLQQK